MRTKSALYVTKKISENLNNMKKISLQTVLPKSCFCPHLLIYFMKSCIYMIVLNQLWICDLRSSLTITLQCQFFTNMRLCDPQQGLFSSFVVSEKDNLVYLQFRNESNVCLYCLKTGTFLQILRLTDSPCTIRFILDERNLYCARDTQIFVIQRNTKQVYKKWKTKNFIMNIFTDTDNEFLYVFTQYNIEIYSIRSDTLGLLIKLFSVIVKINLYASAISACIFNNKLYVCVNHSYPYRAGIDIYIILSKIRTKIKILKKNKSCFKK